ncbi:GntR family transcriptional regulator [Streptomyces sp. NPDC051993]|uniref:GntR family transcriptional regulator n=1 Tax=Streptomyces sp. NPDC051993 TaxID=3155286 RepID=UPI003439F789
MNKSVRRSSAEQQAEQQRALQHVRDRISDGTYAPGDRLPSIDAIAEALGAPRGAVNKVMRQLATEGVIVTRHGSGNYVSRITGKLTRNGTARYRKEAREASVGEGVQSRGAFQTELKAMGFRHIALTEVNRATPPPTVAEILGVSDAEVSTVVRARKMYAVPEADPDDSGRVPVQLADSFMPLEIAGDTQLEQMDTGPGGLISRLAELGHTQVKIEETLNVRPPTVEESAALQLDEEHRVYDLLRVGRTAEGRAVEVTLLVLPVHLWTLRYDLDV